MKSNASVTNNFSTKPLVAAVAMALLAPAAFADNGMPGAGLVVRNQGSITVNGVAIPGGNQIIGLNNNATIQLTAATGVTTVIQWGSPAVLDTANTAGFNLAAGKTLNFTSSVFGYGFLNIDISGALSKIDGKLVADANSFLAVSNEKGITIGSGATITAPYGFAAVGANLNTIDAINAFALNGSLQMNFAGSSPVTVSGDTSGVGAVLLVAGSGAVNVNMSKAPAALVPIFVIGGVGSDYTPFGLPVINDTGPASATVRSSAATNVTLGLGKASAAFDVTANPLTVWANGDLTNTGNLDFKLADVTDVLQWTGKFTNTGTLSSTSPATSLDFDQSTVDWRGNTGSLLVHAKGGLDNSGTISAPDGYVDLDFNGGAMTNSGTITAGNGFVDLISDGTGAVTNSGTITAVGGNVDLIAENGDVTNSGTVMASNAIYLSARSNVSTNPHNVVNSGKLTSTGSYVSLESYYGSVTNTATGVITGTDFYSYANYSTDGVAGHNVNLGAINITSKGGDVEFYNYGPGNIEVGGTVVATGAGNYIGYFSAAHSTNATGTTTVSTPITVLSNKGSGNGIYLSGEKIVVTAPLTVAEQTPGSGAGTIEFYGTNGMGSNVTTIGANLTAGRFVFSTDNGGGLGGQPFDMTVALGNSNLTTTAGGSRSVEFYEVASVTGTGVITANHVVFDTSGNVRSALLTPNYLLNGLRITTVGTAPLVEVTARSPSTQAVNLAITGNATVTSGETVSINNPCYTGLCVLPSGGYIPQSNAGSSLLVTASGNLTIASNTIAGNFIGGGPGGLSNTSGFLFPGGVAFVAGGALNVNTVVDNAFTGTAVPFQGVYFEGATINALQPIYTNGNSLVNYSVRPNGGVGLSTTYQAVAGSNFLGFPNLTAVINPLNSYLNTYTVLANAVANNQPWLPLVNTTPFTQ